ncbi:hypothetical protein [Halomonas binhaiensis]|uniref:Uncharacterized protein n=1 Tax=Halomonas binhaiensis TaxID=2562282 RepID=A0A5C1NHX0_9GAMM|nr:hypothetical protein [Halomonas binhaiensis]QEM82460.1 hypothetical protein E4T21_13575 [Halomonas binhaiensis]
MGVKKYTLGVAVAAAVGVLVGAAGVYATSGQNKSEQQNREQSGAIDQSQVCVATTDEQVLSCEVGKPFMARLNLNGNDVSPLALEQRVLNTMALEQRVLNTMALYCDTNYPIHHTQTGVLCVLTDARIGKLPSSSGQIEEAPEQESNG